MADEHAHYYHATDLARFGEIGKSAPELAKKFFDWYGAVFAEGALTAREKSLIALAVAHTVQCPYCIDAYTQASLEKGSNVEEMTEAVHVAWTYSEEGAIAAYVGGLPYGTPYKTSVQPFESQKAQLAFGLRHAPVGGNRMLAGTILRAAVYDRALAAEEVLAVARASGKELS